jgi:hypothetical protein
MEYPGVYEAKKKDGTLYYRSSLTFHGKHISLGSFPSPQKAAKAYREGLLLLSFPTPSIDSYTEASTLPFLKWVSLINFRNSGIYIKTPIEIRSNYFFYYLSLSQVLKFDIDDLFYYSHHKIMARQGHLFVSDYGMQVNLLSRYGIKSYAVKGRDYRHRNGDDLDFRYENLEIINPYYGVQRMGTPGNYSYKAQIHIRSSYVIGIFSDEIHAAIAYNKAVDALRSQGIDRNFNENYIDNLSGKLYAEIYSSIHLPSHLLHLGKQAPADT